MAPISGLRLFCQFFVAALLIIAYSTASHAQWTRINPGGGGAFTSVGVGPSGLVIATSDLGGAYISHDDGASWDTIGALKGMTMTHVQSIAFHPENDKIVLISGDSDTGSEETGLSFSDDQACHFTPVTFIPSLPAGATVKSVIFAPSQPNIAYASVRSQFDQADSIIYRSEDHGKSFSLAANTFPENDDLGNPVQLAITKLVVHPDNPDLLLALSRPDRFVDKASKGLFQTIDGGDNWQQLVQNNGFFTDISDVVFHPAAPFPVYLSDLNDGYFYNEDINNATSWININSTIDTQGILWPVADNSLQIRIIDTNVSWFEEATEVAWQISSYDNGLAESWITEPLATNRHWTGQDGSNWEAGWSRVPFIFNPPLGGELTKALGYDLSYQSNPDRIFWVTPQFAFRGNLSHSPLAQLDFVPIYTRDETPARLKSLGVPGNNSWKSTGIDNITATLIDVNAKNPDTVYIGLQDVGCFVSRDGGEFWKNCNYLHFTDQPWEGIDGKAYGGSVYALLSDPDNDARVWMAASPGQSDLDSPDGDGLVRILFSHDYGENWAISAGLPDSVDIYGLSLDPTDPNHQTLYVTVNGNIYQTLDGGANWDLLPSNCAGGCRVTAVDLDGNVYAGGESGFLYLPAAATFAYDPTVWTQLLPGFTESNGPFHSANWRGISAIEPELNNHGDILISVFQSAEDNSDHRGGVYRCKLTVVDANNQSRSSVTDPAWQMCTQLLGKESNKLDTTTSSHFPGSFIRDLAVDPNHSNIIYATSSSAYTRGGYHRESQGVLRSSDSGISWQYVNHGLEWPFAVPVSISPAESGVVYIGSPGPGFYKRDFSSNSKLETYPP